ncbi:LuxR C-terminal-related transcriptional regulator [Streptomyces armeniacus]|uniref:LuxR C-terminal-related transcriptional regulator n=1 Tax=Streptomyces armeniacus TaxID=83291 RepID=UPI001FE517D0|nr:response regulator transcription factor [Streptomyces armeniacus]
MVDEQALFRAGIRHLLSDAEGFELAGEAESAERALHLLQELSPAPDVVLIDPRSEAGAGTVAIRALRSEPAPPDGAVNGADGGNGANGANGVRGGRAPRALAVSVQDDDDSVMAALRAGASGYITKQTSERELLRAIEIVAEGGAVFSPVIAKRLNEYFSTPHTASCRSMFPQLTGRETQVLDLLARGWSNGRIAKDLVLTEKTVRNYVSQILVKLDVHHRAEAVVRAREAGLGVLS